MKSITQAIAHTDSHLCDSKVFYTELQDRKVLFEEYKSFLQLCMNS